MRLASVYGAVVLIWSTTPIGISFSVDSLDFIQAGALRMWLSLVLCVLLMKLFRVKLPYSRAAIYSYCVGALAISFAMLCVYWSAQTLSSGLIAVVFGMTPMVVTLYSALLIPGNKISLAHVACMGVALLGLYVIFAQQISLGDHMAMALGVLLFSVSLHSLSSVLMQRQQLKHGQPVVTPLAQTTGALLISAPVYGVAWYFFSDALPAQISVRSLGAVVYLAILGSVVGFIGYFYLLNNMTAASVALITLMTPVISLFIGHFLVAEQLQPRTWFGTGLIMLALVFYQGAHLSVMFERFEKWRLKKA